jgi:hypothetical protein
MEKQSVLPFQAINRTLHKVNRFEVYSNIQIFREIFKTRGEIEYIEFNGANRNFIEYFSKLDIGRRESIIRYLQTF